MADTPLAAEKRLVRRKALARWRQKPASALLAGAAAAGARLTALNRWSRAQRVAVFMAKDDELPTWDLIAAARAGGKAVGLPRVLPGPGRAMEFRYVESLGGLHKSTYGLWEPHPDLCRLMEPAEIDLIIAPGVAFDRDGGRLGRGAGYYDRFLARLDLSAVTVIGWTHGEFVYESLPKGQYDVPVHMVVTPDEVIKVGEPGKTPHG